MQLAMEGCHPHTRAAPHFCLIEHPSTASCLRNPDVDESSAGSWLGLGLKDLDREI